MRLILALIAGMLFGIGLAISGMADPARVHGFLDLFGRWDPTLAFVMGGAIFPMAIAWMIRRRLERPLAEVAFHLPETRKLDGKLALGAILFGIGWGVGGLCPGPAIVGLFVAPAFAAIFVLAMLAGMALHRVTTR